MSSRVMQRSVLPEEKHKNSVAQTEARFIKTIMIRGGCNYLQSFASTSALHCSKRRQISRWPLKAQLCSAVHPLKKNKRINLPHENDENKRGQGG
jgi:hypothetical protein